MLQICVSDIDAAFELSTKSQHKIKITPVQQERWGKVFYTDPHRKICTSEGLTGFRARRRMEGMLTAF